MKIRDYKLFLHGKNAAEVLSAARMTARRLGLNWRDAQIFQDGQIVYLGCVNNISLKSCMEAEDVNKITYAQYLNNRDVKITAQVAIDQDDVLRILSERPNLVFVHAIEAQRWKRRPFAQIGVRLLCPRPIGERGLSLAAGKIPFSPIMHHLSTAFIPTWSNN